VRIWSVFQDLNQMESLYGARWESFVSNAGVVQVFTTNDKKTAEYFSMKVGNYTGVAVSATVVTEDGKALAMPAIFPNLGYALSQIDEMRALVIRHFEQASQIGVQVIAQQREQQLHE
jgi:type IV secretory pathway TraG/TraD family ATPase VirD4